MNRTESSTPTYLIGWEAGAEVYSTPAAVIASASLESAFGGMLNSGAGGPSSAVQATLSFNPTGDDNGLVFTAVEYGTGGNDISIIYRDPSANNEALAVQVSGRTITVHLATGVAGAITSTAAEVLAAIEASAAASALVTVALDTTDTNYVDGSGIVTAMTHEELADGAGTLIGQAPPGAQYIDTDTGDVYINRGTLAVPDWRLPGEFKTTVVPFASAVSVLDNTPKDVATLTLTKGEWDVSAVLVRNLTSVVATRYAAALGTASATIPTGAGGSGLGTDPVVTQFATFGTVASGTYSTVIPPTKVVVSTATKVIYLIAADLFSAGTMTACGTLRARRIS